MRVAELLSTVIAVTGNPSSDEIADLIKREEVASLANERLAKGEISFQDYLDCLEVAEINIDQFLLTADSNCQEAGF